MSNSAQPPLSWSELVTELAGHQRYQLVKPIKHGSFGSVVLADDKHTGVPVALKFIKKEQGSHNFLEGEVLNQMACGRHPHVIALHEVFLTEEHVVLVLEYAAGGDLGAAVPKSGLPEHKARWIFQQLLTALEFCHHMGVAIRDIKLENLLITSGGTFPIIKLCDFGLSAQCAGSSHLEGICGTPIYLAPEAIRGQPYDGKKTDVWSCGVLLYMLLTGSSPFQRQEDSRLERKQRMQALFERVQLVDFEMPSWLSLECKDLLSSMLVADPDLRPSVRALLHHPWCAAAVQPTLLIQCNDALVAKSRANPYPPEVVHEVRSILAEASLAPATPRGKANTAGCSSNCSEETKAWL